MIEVLKRRIVYTASPARRPQGFRGRIYPELGGNEADSLPRRLYYF
jgi:hypothetical protein